MPNLDFNKLVLDANAFYSGVPFLSSAKCYTTCLVYEEISHIRSSFSALEALLEAGNLSIIDPDVEYVDMVIKTAKLSGDLAKLSKADVSIIALALQLGNITLISDDFAVGNVSKHLGIPIRPVSTKGNIRKRKWISFCSACGKAYGPQVKECALCGNRLRRRFKNIP